MAVTNKSHSTLTGHVDAIDTERPAGAISAEQFARGWSFRLAPYSGELCKVRYQLGGSNVLGAEYTREMSRAEATIRGFLRRCGVHKVRTNQPSHLVLVGRIVQGE